jgi:large subunit ribosomal protein L10
MARLKLKSTKEANSKAREKDIPEYKLKLVQEIATKIKSHRTLLIASTKGLPSSQFHEIKKNLRGKAEVKVAKKNLVLRAVDEVRSASLDSMKPQIGADIALFFSNEEPFALSGMLADNQSPTKARAGDIAPEDIKVEPGPTDLVPGPAISELSAVGLKVAVEGGKLAIKLPHTIVKQGDVIKENVAGVMAKLNIAPMKVGFEPIAAYDRTDDKVYVGIKIDKKQTLEDLRFAISKAFGFAIGIKHVSPDTIKYLIAKAGMEEKAFEALINKISAQPEQGASQ